MNAIIKAITPFVLASSVCLLFAFIIKKTNNTDEIDQEDLVIPIENKDLTIAKINITDDMENKFKTYKTSF